MEGGGKGRGERVELGQSRKSRQSDRDLGKNPKLKEKGRKIQKNEDQKNFIARIGLRGRQRGENNLGPTSKRCNQEGYTCDEGPGVPKGRGGQDGGT